MIRCMAPKKKEIGDSSQACRTYLKITKHIFMNIKYSKTWGSLKQHPPELHFIEIYRFPASEVKNKEN